MTVKRKKKLAIIALPSTMGHVSDSLVVHGIFMLLCLRIQFPVNLMGDG
jgi:hypothetical protein